MKRELPLCQKTGLNGTISTILKQNCTSRWQIVREYISYSNGIPDSETVRKFLRYAGFESVNFKLTATGDMGVGTHRYRGENLAAPKEQQLFAFSGIPNKAR